MSKETVKQYIRNQYTGKQQCQGIPQINQQDSLAHSSLKYEKQHGRIVWVMGPACAFDASSRKAFEKLVTNGYVHALLAGNALATHDLEAAWLHTALGQNIYK